LPGTGFGHTFNLQIHFLIAGAKWTTLIKGWVLLCRHQSVKVDELIGTPGSFIRNNDPFFSGHILSKFWHSSHPDIEVD
jgi:hypothetical protein